MSETIFTIAEAARYCRVTQQAIRRAFKENGGTIVEVAALKEKGPRVLQGVRKRDVDALRAAGFLTNKTGRRKNHITRRKVFASL
jgi:hypothetical protein